MAVYKNINPKKNYLKTMQLVGYTDRKNATLNDYKKLEFKSGLEVHQQLLTKEKLFCHCPAGIYQASDDYNAELIRHMRPTLSELGEYDGTALMEFKTKKEIRYRIKNISACTYEVDDTPPFPINNEALNIAIEISLLSKLNIVGEVHITRKQYLDGSIPTGFQRTAIIGVEGEIPLKNKKVRLIQLSIEEDSCREITDIQHTRIFKTDRLGMPLIETVTYPELETPDEVMEACNYIRFLNRSTGKVRTGIGAGREDVNVSCKGGTRVEIKGVAHTKWIPELTHNECYRQWALLAIKKQLNLNVKDIKRWKINSLNINYDFFKKVNGLVKNAKENKLKLMAVNLPGFKGILSHFTQPGKMFVDEISDRLKVIACIEKPNLIHTEQFEKHITKNDFNRIRELLNASDEDAQLIILGPKEDLPTAFETIEERCKMAFEGVPKETRKSFSDGTTIFERVLPGADRMYPDTDSPPIPLEDKLIEDLSKGLPAEVIENYHQLKKWNVPEDTFTYIFKKNLFPVIEKISNELKLSPLFTGTFFGHTLKYVEGHYSPAEKFNYKIIYGMFKYLIENKLNIELSKSMIPVLYEHPKLEFESVLTLIKFKRIPEKEILSRIPFLVKKYKQIRISNDDIAGKNWIMGELRKTALGNINLSELSKLVSLNEK
ncbi:MAG: Glu-tRNA(Gln) amidotransferase subunit GatE [Chlorobi bacterium]|nr:Glu-tRNA(Gln) amidotransferase subunit GatE [Chlorobiota bacterium]